MYFHKLYKNCYKMNLGKFYLYIEEERKKFENFENFLK